MSENNPLVTSRRRVLKKGALVTGLSVVGGVTMSGTAAAGSGEDRVGHYPLNDVEPDGTVPDASPENNDGMNNGADVVRGGGQVGNAFDFDATGSEYVRVPHDDSLQLTTFTVAAWVTIPRQRGDYEFFLSKRSSASGEYQAYYSKDQGLIKYWNGTHIYQLALDLASETWHHLAWVFDGSEFIGYHDGTEVGRTSAKAPQQGTNDLFIGTDNVGNFVEAMNDEVFVYDRVLSSSEIQSLAAMGGESS